MDAQSQKVVSADALPVCIGNTPVDRTCAADLEKFLITIGMGWLRGPFIANRVWDMAKLRTLTSTDLMNMNIAPNPCDFLLQALANQDQVRTG